MGGLELTRGARSQPSVAGKRGRAAGTTDYGQARAHRELTERFLVTWRWVCRNSFQVVSVGARGVPADGPQARFASAPARRPPAS